MYHAPMNPKHRWSREEQHALKGHELSRVEWIVVMVLVCFSLWMMPRIVPAAIQVFSGAFHGLGLSSEDTLGVWLHWSSAYRNGYVVGMRTAICGSFKQSVNTDHPDNQRVPLRAVIAQQITNHALMLQDHALTLPAETPLLPVARRWAACRQALQVNP